MVLLMHSAVTKAASHQPAAASAAVVVRAAGAAAAHHVLRHRGGVAQSPGSARVVLHVPQHLLQGPRLPAGAARFGLV